MPSPAKTGTNSCGNSARFQYLLMTGATSASSVARTRASSA